MKTTTLPYWGQIIGLVSRQPDTDNTTKKTTKSVALSVAQGRSLFITRKPIGAHESTATLYRLDNTGEQVSLAAATLPSAMEAIATVTDDTIMLLGCDGHLYQTDWQGETIHKISDMSLFTSVIESHNSIETADTDTDITFKDFAKSLSTNSNPQAIAMTTLHQAIVVLYPHHIVICPLTSSATGDVAVADDKVIVQPCTDSQTQKATALAASGDGKWLVIGDELGNVSSYQWLSDDDDNSGQLIQSSRKPLHQGRVSALCFEPIGHYFFSFVSQTRAYLVAPMIAV